MRRVSPLLIAFLFAPLAHTEGEKFSTEQLELSSVAKAAVEAVERGRSEVKFALAPECRREAVAAIATVRPVITYSQLQALKPAPASSSYFVVTSLRISTENPEWAWFEGHFFLGPRFTLSLSRGSDAVWRAGGASICFHC